MHTLPPLAADLNHFSPGGMQKTPRTLLTVFSVKVLAGIFLIIFVFCFSVIFVAVHNDHSSHIQKHHRDLIARNKRGPLHNHHHRHHHVHPPHPGQNHSDKQRLHNFVSNRTKQVRDQNRSSGIAAIASSVKKEQKNGKENNDEEIEEVAPTLFTSSTAAAAFSLSNYSFECLAPLEVVPPKPTVDKFEDTRPAYMRAESLYPVPSPVLPDCSPRRLCTKYKSEMENRESQRRNPGTAAASYTEWWRDASQPGGRILRDDNVVTSARIAIVTLMARLPKKKTAKDIANEERGVPYVPPPQEQLDTDDFLFEKTVSVDFGDSLRQAYIDQPWWWRRMHFLSFVNKALYVLRRRKYDLVIEGKDFFAENNKTTGVSTRNSPAWAKIQILLKWLDKGSYAWLMWQDADAFFTKMTVPLACFLPRKTPEEMTARRAAMNAASATDPSRLSAEREKRKKELNAPFAANLLRKHEEHIHEDADDSDEAAEMNDSDEFAMYPGDASFARSHADILMAKDPRGWNDGVFFLKRSDFSRKFLNQMWSVTDAEAMRYGYHDQGAILIITDEKNQKSGGHMQAAINIFHMFELDPARINAYPAPLLSAVLENQRRKYEFVEGTSVVAHFPSAKDYVSAPSWVEYLYSFAYCTTKHGDARTPPPPSVLYRDYNISIGKSCFRVLGSPPLTK